MPAARPTRRLDECLANLQASARSDMVHFMRERRFRSDEDIKSAPHDIWVVKMLMRDMRTLLRAIRDVERRHGFSHFDVGLLSVVGGENNQTWLARCAEGIEHWLAENRT